MRSTKWPSQGGISNAEFKSINRIHPPFLEKTIACQITLQSANLRDASHFGHEDAVDIIFYQYFSASYWRKRISPHKSEMISYPLNYSFDEGYFDLVQFERCGLIRLEGWFSGRGLQEFEFIKCHISGEEIPLFQVFRTYRPDVAAALESHNSYQGLILTYRVSQEMANKPIRLSFNDETIFNKPEGFQVEEPAYVHLLDAEQVMHRQHIYGSGPGSTTVVDEIFELAKVLPPPILDFGCGTGALVKKLREGGIEAYGIELQRAQIVEGILPEAKPYIDFYEGDFPLPYKSGEFRSVFAGEVIEHVPAYEDALSEIARIASTNFTMTVPDVSAIPVSYHNGVVPWHLLEATHINFFNQTNLKHLLERHFSEVEFARVCPMRTNNSYWFVSLVAMCRKTAEASEDTMFDRLSHSNAQSRETE